MDRKESQKPLRRWRSPYRHSNRKYVYSYSNEYDCLVSFFFAEYSEITSCSLFRQYSPNDISVSFIHFVAFLGTTNGYFLLIVYWLVICHFQASERAVFISGHSSFMRNNGLCILKYHYITFHTFFTKSIKVLHQPPRLFYKHKKKKNSFMVSVWYALHFIRSMKVFLQKAHNSSQSIAG